MAITYEGMINLDRLGLYDSLIKQAFQDALDLKSDIGHTHNAASIIKYDTVAGWAENLSYIPANGEIIVVTDYATDGNGNNIAAIKIGDGRAYAADLPIIMQDHINDTDIHVTAANKNFWNSKWSGHISATDSEELVFTTN